MSAFAHVEYIPYPEYPKGGNVYVNGVRINRVKALEFTASVDSLPEVTMHLASDFKYDGLAKINLDIPVETLRQAIDCLRFYCMSDAYGIRSKLIGNISEALCRPLDDTDTAEHILESILSVEVADAVSSGHSPDND